MIGHYVIGQRARHQTAMSCAVRVMTIIVRPTSITFPPDLTPRLFPMPRS